MLDPGPWPHLEEPGEGQAAPAEELLQAEPEEATAQTPVNRCWVPGAAGSWMRGAVQRRHLSHVLPTVGDDHLLLRLPVLAALCLDLPQDIQAFRDLPEHHVLAVQPVRLVTRQEELGAVGVRAGVGHGEQAWSRVLEDEVLIIELPPVDGLAPGAVVVGEIAALAHELGDDAVEAAPLEAKALLVGAQATEILCRHGNDV